MNHEHLQLLVTRVMPYGKYKGRLIADLPGRYLNWFARKGFPPDLQDEATNTVLAQAEPLSAIWVVVYIYSCFTAALSMPLLIQDAHGGMPVIQVLPIPDSAWILRI